MKVIFCFLFLMIASICYSQTIEKREDFLGVIRKQIKKSRCNEVGKVTVEISANSVGIVIAAKYIEEDKKISECLIEEALHHAKNLQFIPNKGAPEIQTTRVIYDIGQIE